MTTEAVGIRALVVLRTVGHNVSNFEVFNWQADCIRKGFSGSQKLFLFEFSMPMTNKTGFNADMPAIWLMNAQIPLTSQYGENPDCSCWTSGCGEFDIFEILDSGNIRCKSTLHMAPAGSSSDWFQRPTQNAITVAVVFHGNNEVEWRYSQ